MARLVNLPSMLILYYVSLSLSLSFCLSFFLSFLLSRTHTHTHTHSNVTCRINPDYVSPRITEALIQRGRRSCFMIDKKGFLPAHVACSRHCSPEKLDMLLRVNPDSLFAITSSGDTLLSLATKIATKSHLIMQCEAPLEEHDPKLR